MALPTTLTNVTTRKLGSTLNSLWTKAKSYFVNKSGDTMSGRLTLEKPLSQVLIGTGTAASSSSGTYYPAKWNFNLGIATPTAGDQMVIKLPVAGSDYGVYLSTDNGTTYFPVARHTGASRLTTQYPIGAYVCVVFEAYVSGSSGSGQVNDIFPVAGGTARKSITTGCWRVINDYDSGNTICQLRTENGRFYAGSTGCNPYSLVCLDKDGKYSMLISSGSGTGTSKTINTTGKFKLNPVILYYSANNTTTANALVPSTYATFVAHQSVDTRYSHNYTTTFTTNSPLYIECTIDADGYWSPTTKCITQTLTTGNYYIYLGQTYSTAYQVSLLPDHPVYYYDGTNLTEVPRLSKADRTKLDGIASGATKVDASTTNGKIKINGTDTTVYTHPTQTAYSAKGSATKVPKITTDSTGHVTSIEEVTISGVAPASHAHGNIANGGTLTDTAAAAAGNDYVVIRDADNAKIQTSTIKGTDVADAVSKKHSHSTLTLSTTAQAYDGSHTLALPSTDPYTSARTPASHTHGNIANGGTLTDTAAAAAGNDYVVIRDADNSKIQTSTIKGTDVADAVSKKHSHSTLTLSTTAQAYDGSHTLALPSTDPYTSARTPASHTHGNITNGGALQANDVTIASGDKLVVTDSSDSNKVARTSVSFDGSTTTKALTPKGTFEAFAKSGDIETAIQALDVSSVGGDGKYISAISETDGKISATATTMDTTPTASSTKAVTSGGIKTALDKKVDIANVSLESQSTTILAQVQSMASNQIHYKRFYTSSDGGSANISDKPTGTTNAGFVLEAYCNRYVSSSDWRYVVLCYVQTNRPKIAWITNGTTSISWQDLNTNTDTKVTQTADNSSTGTGFELLFSATADNTTRTEASRKSSKLTFQPSTGTLTATKFSGPLTGNVTGNCSGSSGSCTGNAATATTATNANITRTADTTNGDKLQIGTGTAVNITNAKHAASADSASKVTNKLTLKIKTGSTEGTNLYTYDGSAAKTLDIKQGSNITLTAAAGSLTIAGTDTKNTVGVGPVTHTYDASYYVPFTSSSPTSASNAQSYTSMSGEGYSNTALLSFVDDPVKGMQGFITGNLIGRFNGVPPETADGKLVTVGMDGQLVVSSILEADVALTSNVEPLLTQSRGVAKLQDSANGAITGFYCDSGSGGSDKYGIRFGSGGGLTYNNSYIIHTVTGDASGYMHLFEGIAQYAYSATSASSATTALYLACTSSNEVNIKKDPTQSASSPKQYFNYRDADGTASSSVVQLLDYYFCDRKQSEKTTNLRAGHFISTNASTSAYGMEVHRNNGDKDAGMLVERSDKTYNGKTLSLVYGIGTGGDNYGIWSDPLGCWAIKGVASQNKVYIHAGGTGTANAKYISFVAGSIGTEADTIYFP